MTLPDNCLKDFDRKFSLPIYIPTFTVTEAIEVVDNMVGLKDKISTHHMREKYLKSHFNFLEPQEVPIENNTGDNMEPFFYYASVRETLQRLLNDPTLRRYLINNPMFTSTEVRFEF